jgi:hypothetical protein
MTEPAAAAAPTEPSGPHNVERGWGKLLLAIAAFLFIPTIPQMRALLPVEQTMLLLVPSVAACALVGWWAGGRAFIAIAWVALAVVATLPAGGPPTAFYNLTRGWSLLLAGAFGLVCLLSVKRPLFSRALAALGATLALATIMSLLGPVTLSRASATVAAELDRRNTETMSTLRGFISTHPREWQDFTAKVPQLATLPDETDKQLRQLSRAGAVVFPALLALQSLLALALAWATYHRLSRARLGAPLGKLKEFRFNDQLVWGLIVGLTIVLLPTLATIHTFGSNLLVFFGALYAIRGFGVLSWFMTPGALGVTVGVGFIMLALPVLNILAALVFMMLGIAAVALGLGDTWADWRNRTRPTANPR